MFNKRLLEMAASSKKHIIYTVVLQWLGLIASIISTLAIAGLLERVYLGTLDTWALPAFVITYIIALLVRMACTVAASHTSFLSAKTVKKDLRRAVYQKLSRLGASYTSKVSSAEVVQVTGDGIDQLESYFGAYLPQFFYALLAPLTLFVVVCPINLAAALVLLVCVPLIPVSIIAVQKFAKRLLSKYWGQYTALGDSFLENLQGLTTLKIFGADAQRSIEMDEEAEAFRKITMRVLIMQLNSVTVMDIVAYGGAALGILVAGLQFSNGNVALGGAIAIVLLSAEFFLPMRQLGSFFHTAMNGNAAAEKIFRILDLPENEMGTEEISRSGYNISINGLSFSYNGSRTVLSDICLDVPQGSLVSIVGESGSGKSTLAGLLAGRNSGYSGSITIGGTELTDINEANRMKNICYIGHNSYLFQGTVRDNLLMAAPDADDGRLWAALEQAKLADFLRGEQGLDTGLLENAVNLSGGQRQRLALARALLRDGLIYIFDEATSNVDVESENDILDEIYALSGNKTVIMIAHRLANVVSSDHIYVMKQGVLAEHGTHQALLERGDVYGQLWSRQQELEKFTAKGI